MKIKTKVQRIQKKIAEYEKELRTIQDECEHATEIQYTPKSSTGNYYNIDEYRYDFKCIECGKRWSTPQNRISYLYIDNHKNAIEV